jgi:hypothetical protein
MARQKQHEKELGHKLEVEMMEGEPEELAEQTAEEQAREPEAVEPTEGETKKVEVERTAPSFQVIRGRAIRVAGKAASEKTNTSPKNLEVIDTHKLAGGEVWRFSVLFQNREDKKRYLVKTSITIADRSAEVEEVEEVKPDVNNATGNHGKK